MPRNSLTCQRLNIYVKKSHLFFKDSKIKSQIEKYNFMTKTQ